jgi:arylformamidase
MIGVKMLHDVTKALHNGIPVWPGDVEFERNTVRIGDFSSSSVRMSLHTGTHMDAPRHRFENGRAVDRIMPFIVPALVNIQGDCHGKAVLSDGPVSAPEAQKLVDAGAVLVGTASISIDPPDSYQAHEIILGAGIPVIENLVLDGIQPGEYILLAFPLKFKDADGSPVRVLLADSTEDVLKECGADILNR